PLGYLRVHAARRARPRLRCPARACQSGREAGLLEHARDAPAARDACRPVAGAQRGGRGASRARSRLVLPRVPNRRGRGASAVLPPHGTIAGEFARLACVLAAYGALFAIAEAWRRRSAPPVEWTRKLVHLGSGVISAGFPWWFAYQWTVLAL